MKFISTSNILVRKLFLNNNSYKIPDGDISLEFLTNLTSKLRLRLFKYKNDANDDEPYKRYCDSRGK
jgi:hypothetical protein